MHHCPACYSLNRHVTGTCQHCGVPFSMGLAPGARAEGEALNNDLLAFVPNRRAPARRHVASPHAGPLAIAFTMAIAILIPALLT